MANSYYDEAGTLVLAKVTPVITAFFGEFTFDPTVSDSGEAAVAAVAEGAPSWDDIHGSLQTLVASLGLRLPADADNTVEEDLYALASHFGRDGDVELGHVIEHLNFDSGPDLKLLFDLAQHFDDGHGLKAIKLEGCWRCDRPRPFESGGCGYYRGRHFMMSTSSKTATQVGARVDEALVAGDVGQAAMHLARHVQGILAGVSDAELAATLRTMVMGPWAHEGELAQSGAQTPSEATPDDQLSAGQLEQRYSPEGDGEHPMWLRDEWRAAVANEDTVLGYWPWLYEKVRNPEY